MNLYDEYHERISMWLKDDVEIEQINNVCKRAMQKFNKTRGSASGHS